MTVQRRDLKSHAAGLKVLQIILELKRPTTVIIVSLSAKESDSDQFHRIISNRPSKSVVSFHLKSVQEDTKWEKKIEKKRREASKIIECGVRS